MFIKTERLPGNPTSCIFRCFRSFFTDIICSQSLRRENFTITLSLSFLRRWHASMSRGDTSLPIFLKMVSTLSSNMLFWTMQKYPPLHIILFWNTGRLPCTVFPYQPIISITMNWLAWQHSFQIQADYISDSTGVLDHKFRCLQILHCFKVIAE